MTMLHIGKRKCGDDYEPLMFAEEGQANQGSLELALQMVDHAANAGADGIEFQLFLAADMYIRKDPLYKLYLKNELNEDQIVELIRATKQKGLAFQAACLSPNIVKVCSEAAVDSFCVNATDLNNPFILDAVSSSGIPFWLATLFATMEEIDWVVEYLLRRGATNFGLLHGQHVMSSNNGVPPELVQLDCIDLFKKRYGVVVGFVDHTPTLYLPALAVAKGASIVMKHLAPHAGWKGPDYAVCLNPDDWKKSRELVHYTALTFGESKELSIVEIKDRSLMRRSLYTKFELPEGHVVTIDDVIALRPGEGGLDPRVIKRLVGRKTSAKLPEQQILHEHDVCQDEVE